MTCFAEFPSLERSLAESAPACHLVSCQLTRRALPQFLTSGGTLPLRIAGVTGGWPVSSRMRWASVVKRNATKAVASFGFLAVPVTVAALRIASLMLRLAGKGTA